MNSTSNFSCNESKNDDGVEQHKDKIVVVVNMSKIKLLD